MFPRIYKEFKPADHLTHYIKCYWLFENEYSNGKFEHVFPDSSYELVYEQKALFSVANTQLPRLYVLGQLEKPTDFYADGVVRQWAVRFYPWGLQPFGNIEVLADHIWQPADKVVNDAAELEKRMQLSEDAKVINGLDDFFLEKLLSWQFSDRVLTKAVNELKKQKGSIKLKDLAEYCFISKRQLARKISQATGRTPHDIASRLRFERVRDAIMHNPNTPLTFLAAQCGYTDQSHLIKEFRQFMNMTPSSYAEVTRSEQPQLKNTQHMHFLHQESHTTETRIN